jgi:hypothetical protein
MNSFALITAIALAADFSLAAASIARVRIMMGLRKSLTALVAFVIATSFIASSFAGEFTVHQGKRYRATLSLSSSSGWSTMGRSRRNSALSASPACAFLARARRARWKACGQART